MRSRRPIELVLAASLVLGAGRAAADPTAAQAQEPIQAARARRIAAGG